MDQQTARVELLICTRCQRTDQPGDSDDRPGAALYKSLSGAGLDAVTVTPVECLSNCSRGCTIALRGPGRWTYVYGNLDERSHLDAIRDGARKYCKSPDGLVPWRDRPEHFRKNCIARIPPMETV
ncbi:DUF1636 family protein [Paracoccus aestuariivivens]|uniref:DUF1636 domain-containing protein n=1 Tax=Paracoccus aestuariivivens TaxID=1820333 RepID=A0A6L6JC41_9RHOB|nr:DUF1636 domain-containing protein [Paracoccus aestuariivivens]MTH79763.1 DUF1636 domain-containing protein [Paracoccus aestuariivivens]